MILILEVVANFYAAGYYRREARFWTDTSHRTGVKVYGIAEAEQYRGLIIW